MATTNSLDKSSSLGGNYRWFICFLLFAATTINYIDRQIFGLLKPELEKVFGWSEMDYSRIVMAFTVCYACGLLVYGRIIDKIGTRLGYTISVTIWSAVGLAYVAVKWLDGGLGAVWLTFMFTSPLGAFGNWYMLRRRLRHTRETLFDTPAPAFASGATS